MRGQANTWPMTADMALRLGAAAGRYFRQDKQEHRVVIGKDTRRSGYMLEYALTAGFTSTGMNVFLLGAGPDTRDRLSDAFPARRCRRDDLGQPQPGLR